MTKKVFALLLLVAFLAAAAIQKEYVVKDHDTLSNIIWTLRAQGVDVSKLGDWNPKLGTFIVPGQRILYNMPEQVSSPPQITKAEIEEAVGKALALAAARQRVYDAELSAKNAQNLSIVVAAVSIMLALALLGGIVLRRKSTTKIAAAPLQEVSFPIFRSIVNGRPIDPTLAELKKCGQFPLPIYVSVKNFSGLNLLVPAVAEHDSHECIWVRFHEDSRPVAKSNMRKSAIRLVQQSHSDQWGSRGIVIAGGTDQTGVLRTISN